MPTFCRHNRFVENCPICSKTERTRPGTARGRRAPAVAPPGRGAPRRPPSARRPPRGGDLKVRRLARAADDGYDHELVPGLRASADAGPAGRRARLLRRRACASSRPTRPGCTPRRRPPPTARRRLWLAFLIAYLSPLEAEDPWAAIAAARTPWATGELPELDDVDAGPAQRPRGAPRRPRAPGGVPRLGRPRGLAGGRAGGRAALDARSGASTAPSSAWRCRASARGARYEFLLAAWAASGSLDVEPWSLMLARRGGRPDRRSPPSASFGIGDPMELRQRASAPGDELDVPVEPRSTSPW